MLTVNAAYPFCHSNLPGDSGNSLSHLEAFALISRIESDTAIDCNGNGIQVTVDGSSGTSRVVLQNNTGPASPGSLADDLVEAVLGPAEEPDATPYEGDLSAFTGTYAGRGRGRTMTVQVEAKEGGLVARGVGQRLVVVVHLRPRQVLDRIDPDTDEILREPGEAPVKSPPTRSTASSPSSAPPSGSRRPSGARGRPPGTARAWPSTRGASASWRRSSPTAGRTSTPAGS